MEYTEKHEYFFFTNQVYFINTYLMYFSWLNFYNYIAQHICYSLNLKLLTTLNIGTVFYIDRCFLINHEITF